MRKLFGLSAAAALLAGASLVGAGSAFAANCPATSPGNTTDSCGVAASVTLNQGSLSIVAPSLNTFSAVNLGGAQGTASANQSSTATWAGTFLVSDATGTGNGWAVTAQSPAFSCTYNASSNPRCPQTGGDTFPTSELNGGAFSSAVCHAAYVQQHCGTGATAGRGAIPVTDAASGGFIDTAAGSQEFHALASTGMGSYDVTLANLSLVVPNDAYAATYTTTITYTLSSGPGSN